jgi:hypothetical protein
MPRAPIVFPTAGALRESSHRAVAAAFFAALILVLHALPAAAGAPEILSDEEEAMKFAANVVNAATKSDLPQATRDIGRYAARTVDVDGFTRDIEQAMSSSMKKSGALLSQEQIRTEKVKDILLRVTFVVRFEQRPVRWVFLFYHGKEKWLLDGLHIDDRLEPLFDWSKPS